MRAQKGVPVFFIQHSAASYLKYGSDGWQLHPQMQPVADEVIVHKQHGNSFEDTDLKDELSKRNVNMVVVTGLVTHGCVKATCLAHWSKDTRSFWWVIPTATSVSTLSS
ncbi:MAG: isochorismatase family protein [Anaerolineaceae bacterium]|jgi:nicotinamidase-related amidase